MPATLDLQPLAREPVRQKLGVERGRLAPAHERRMGVRRNLGGEFLLHAPARPVHGPEFLPHGAERERLEPGWSPCGGS